MKNKKQKKLFIYSTNPNIKFDNEEKQDEKYAAKDQNLELYRKSYKGGKVAIIIENFIGEKNDLKA